jgi:hypothetical protein
MPSTGSPPGAIGKDRTAVRETQHALVIVGGLLRQGDNVLDTFHGEQSQGPDVCSAELTVLLRERQQQLLEGASFRSVDFFRTFEFAPYDEATSDRLIAIARR